MFWQCSECGGRIDAVPRVSVCPECGTASDQIVADTSPESDLSDLREYWVQTGMAQEAPVLGFEEVSHA
jgi:predicted  nucleic acid-binding Zn-ribbon protein